MLIYRALKTNWKTQGFGVENTSPLILSKYQSYGLLGHNGWDWFCYYKEPIYWDCDIRGTVLRTSIDSNGGLGVEVLSEDKDGLFIHRFWHFVEFKCVAGQILEGGDLIGLGDSTGMATGNHLHRDLKKVERTSINTFNILNKDNGYHGCLDPTPYFKNIFVVDYRKLLEAQVSILKQLIEAIKKLLLLKVGGK